MTDAETTFYAIDIPERESWLRWRLNFITSSEASTVVGINPYSSKYVLNKIKKREAHEPAKDEDLEAELDWNRWREREILEWWHWKMVLENMGGEGPQADIFQEKVILDLNWDTALVVPTPERNQMLFDWLCPDRLKKKLGKPVPISCTLDGLLLRSGVERRGLQGARPYDAAETHLASLTGYSEKNPAYTEDARGKGFCLEFRDDQNGQEDDQDGQAGEVSEKNLPEKNLLGKNVATNLGPPNLGPVLALLECKTAHYWGSANWYDDDKNLTLPKPYKAQMQHQMMVTGVGVNFSVVSIGGARPQYLREEADERAWAALYERYAEFWLKVREGEDEEIDEHPQTRAFLGEKLYEDEYEANLGPVHDQHLDTIAGARDRMAAIKDEKDKATNAILEAMVGCRVGVTPSGRKAKVMRAANGSPWIKEVK